VVYEVLISNAYDREGIAMKMFTGPTFSHELLHSLANARTKKKGLLSREPLEIFEIKHPIMRGFRQVDFFDENDELIASSLLDVEMASMVEILEERLLLWRPLYVGLTKEDTPFEFSTNTIKQEDLEIVLNEMISIRKEACIELDELKNEFGSAQDGWKSSTMSLFVPRTPSSLRKQEKIADAKRTVEGVVKAISLVTNCPLESKIESARMGEYVLVQTTFLRFIINEDGSMRILVLENPSSEDIKEALMKGRALTRLLELNKGCSDYIVQSIFHSESSINT